jgi:hypothetical protein
MEHASQSSNFLRAKRVLVPLCVVCPRPKSCRLSVVREGREAGGALRRAREGRPRRGRQGRVRLQVCEVPCERVTCGADPHLLRVQPREPELQSFPCLIRTARHRQAPPGTSAVARGLSLRSIPFRTFYPSFPRPGTFWNKHQLATRSTTISSPATAAQTSLVIWLVRRITATPL